MTDFERAWRSARRPGETPDTEADPDTPPGAEARLQAFQDDLEQARKDLRAARDAEVDAKSAYKAKLREAILSPLCPKVGTVIPETGERVTVRLRDAWAENHAARELEAWEIAKATRAAAADRFQTLRTQGGFQQSITASVRETYRTGGRLP